MATPLTQCAEFSALQKHYEAAAKLHMRSLFESDPQRFDKFRYKHLQYRLEKDRLAHLFCLDWS